MRRDERFDRARVPRAPSSFVSFSHFIPYRFPFTSLLTSRFVFHFARGGTILSGPRSYYILLFFPSFFFQESPGLYCSCLLFSSRSPPAPRRSILCLISFLLPPSRWRFLFAAGGGAHNDARGSMCAATGAAHWCVKLTCQKYKLRKAPDSFSLPRFSLIPRQLKLRSICLCPSPPPPLVWIPAFAALNTCCVQHGWQEQLQGAA